MLSPPVFGNKPESVMTNAGVLFISLNKKTEETDTLCPFRFLLSGFLRNRKNYFLSARIFFS